MHQPPGRIGVEDVEIGELPAPVLDDVVPPRVLADHPVAGAVLVGVLAVPHRPGPLEDQLDGLGEQDGPVELLGPVGGCPGPRARRARPRWRRRTPRCGRRPARASRRRVSSDREPSRRSSSRTAPYSSGRDHDADMVVVLRRRPHHGGPPDVDELDGRIGGERIEVAHHQVDEADALPLDVGQVVGLRPVGQDASVDGGVEGLDPAAEHLGCAGQVGHFDVVDPGLGQGGGGATARDQLPARGRRGRGPDRPGRSCRTPTAVPSWCNLRL